MTPQPETSMTKAEPPKTEIRHAPRMNISELMQRKSRGQIAASQAPAIPGGHKYVCSSCGGPRVHATELFAPGEPINRQELQNLILQRDGTRVEIRVSKTQEQPSTKARLAIICRSCGATHVLTYQGEGRWMPEAFANRLNRQVKKRQKGLRERFESSLKAALEKPPVPELVEPVTRRNDDKSIDELLDSIDREKGGRESEGVLPRDNRPGSGSNGEARMTLQNPGPDATRPAHPGRTRTRVALGLVCAPFLLMGVLYLLAWNGIYVWPIYYAIQPYWRPFMDEWWFWGASLYVPAAVAAVYIWQARSREDVIDWTPEPRPEPKPEVRHEHKTKPKYERPKWLDEG